MTKPTPKIINQRVYTDEEVFVAIRGKFTGSRLVSNWFFQKAKEYAMGTWQKKYPRLQEVDWGQIFSEVNYKIIRRINNDLELKNGTQLLTYYTMVTEYAILDFITQHGKETTQSFDSAFVKEVSLPSKHLERQELAVSLNSFLEKVTQNKAQVQVLSLFNKGYSYKEIVQQTEYKSEGACRNAYLKAKKKIIAYITQYPEQGKRLKKLLQDQI